VLDTDSPSGAIACWFSGQIEMPPREHQIELLQLRGGREYDVLRYRAVSVRNCSLTTVKNVLTLDALDDFFPAPGPR